MVHRPLPPLPARRLAAAACLVLSAAVALAAPAPLDDAARLRDSAMKGSGALATVTELVTEVGPRLAGSAGDRAAVRWATARLSRAGLSDVHALPVTVPHWVRGTASAVLEGSPARPLAVVSLGGTPGTGDEPLRAELVVLADFKALEALPAEALSGKIAYVANRMRRGDAHRAYADAVIARNEGPALAASKGALAYLLRSVGTDEGRTPHTGMTEFPAGLTPIPALAVSAADADLIERRAAAGPAPVVTLQSSARLLAPEPSADVAGELAGDGTLPGVVLIGAHLDSWDLAEGAQDDGAGVAIAIATLERIRALGLRPHRTVRIVLYANEEQTGTGAVAYAEAASRLNEPHVAALEADFGGGRVTDLRVDATLAAGRWVGALATALKPLGIRRSPEPAHGGADLKELKDRGVPVVDLVQDGTHYFDVHHSANDVVSTLSAADLDQAVAAYAATVWLLANEADLAR